MFLRDYDILQLVRSGNIIGIKLPTHTSDRYALESHIQPCSLDLTVGKIFLAPEKIDELSTTEPVSTDEVVLKTGQTAVVETEEEFKLPDNVAGFGFPPARVSRNGVLMTNPGHVDAGYEGRLSFTLVNMGRGDYPLEKGKPICTVLLFHVGRPIKSYRDRLYGKSSPSAPFRSILNKLSPDFLDVDERATLAANNAVKNAQLTLRHREIWIPIISGIFALIAAAGSIGYNVLVTQSKVDVLEERIQKLSLESRVSTLESGMDFERQLSDIRDRLDALEN